MRPCIRSETVPVQHVCGLWLHVQIGVDTRVREDVRRGLVPVAAALKESAVLLRNLVQVAAIRGYRRLAVAALPVKARALARLQHDLIVIADERDEPCAFLESK